MGPQEFRERVFANPDPANGLRTLMGISSGNCEGCGGCCGRVLPMSAHEERRLVKYVNIHRVSPSSDSRDMCALLDPDTRMCMAYEARPFVCRVWDSPAHCSVITTGPECPCGCREDMGQMFLKAFRVMRPVDTWELFGLSDSGN